MKLRLLRLRLAVFNHPMLGPPARRAAPWLAQAWTLPAAGPAQQVPERALCKAPVAKQCKWATALRATKVNLAELKLPGLRCRT